MSYVNAGRCEFHIEVPCTVDILVRGGDVLVTRQRGVIEVPCTVDILVRGGDVLGTRQRGAIEVPCTVDILVRRGNTLGTRQRGVIEVPCTVDILVRGGGGGVLATRQGGSSKLKTPNIQDICETYRGYM